MSVKIITDSAADLPSSIAEKHGIDVIPLRVILGDQQFTDGVSLESKTLFQGMREGNVYKTSQPAIEDVFEVFERYAKEGTSCIYIGFSSELSGTYQTALMVYNQVLDTYPDFDMTLVDTKCASIGEGLVALFAAQMAEKGKSKDEIVEAVQFYAKHMEHIFTVDDLKYLLRGGRVSPVAAFVGGLLNIKPVLHVDNGKLIPIEKIRGRKKVINRLVELVGERGKDLSNQLIGISHGDDLETAEQLQAMIKERYGCNNFLIGTIGGAIGAHAGPGTLSVFFLNELYDKA